MVKLVRFQISENYLWGYNTLVDIHSVNSSQDIVNIVLNNCQQFLRSNNLLGLVDHLEDNKNRFHIHGFSFNEYELAPDNETFYVCCHDH
jgi:hypothetical protein